MANILEAVSNALRGKPEPALPKPGPGNLTGTVLAANLAAHEAATKREASDKLISDPRAFFGLVAQKSKHVDDAGDLQAYLDGCSKWEVACRFYTENRGKIADAMIAAQANTISAAIAAGQPLPEARSKEQMVESLRGQRRGIMLAMTAGSELAKDPALRLQQAFVTTGRKYVREVLLPMDRALCDEWQLPYEMSAFIRLVDLALSALNQQLGPDARYNGPLSNPRNWCPWIPKVAAK